MPTRTALVLALSAAVLAPGSASAQTPSPAPTHVDEARPACASAVFTVDRPVVRSGEVVTVSAERVPSSGRRNDDESQRLDLRLVRRLPAPEALVRSDTSTATVVTWPVRLGESHLFQTGYVDRNPDRCFPLGRPNGVPLEVDVQPVLSISALRNGPRDYTFSGRVQPARGQTVTLYRHTSTGSRVRTAQGTVRTDGTYRIDRRFTGSGRFGFSVAVGQTAAHLAGASRVRPTVLH